MDDLRLFRTFLEVIRHGSMADAAITLKCSGPAVSQQIARLEKELGVVLLLRHSYGVELTPAGEVLATRARDALGLNADLVIAVREAANIDAPRLRLGAFSTASVNLLPGAIKDFVQQFPQTQVSLVETYDDLAPFTPLLSGDIDLVLVHEYDHVPVAVPPGVSLHEFGNDPMDVVLPKGHALAKRRVVDLGDLSNEDWVLFPPGNVATTSISRAAADAGFEPRTSFVVADTQVVWSIVSSGIGISLLPRMVTTGLNQAVFEVRPLKQALHRTIFAATRLGDSSRAAQGMTEALKRQFIAKVRRGNGQK